MRRFFQLFFLAAFTLLFFLNPYSERIFIPVDIFLRADPLLSLTTYIASRQFHPNLLISLVVVLSAVVMGRMYCAWICPLGTLFDLSPGAEKQKKTGAKNIKYILLFALIMTAFFGLNLAFHLDPISLLTRFFTLLLYPLSVFLANMALDAARPAAGYLDWITLYYTIYSQPVFLLSLVTLLIMSALFIINYFSRRFWCKTLCPLGALLGLLSALKMIKRRVTDACNGCGRCQSACDMEAIPENPSETEAFECTLCLDCSKTCPQRAVTFPLRMPIPSFASSGCNLSRRSFLGSAAAGLSALYIHRTDIKQAVPPSRLIRPPGAVPEPLFLQRCIRCGQCMKVCPTNTLQPCFLESGLEGIYSPKLLPRLAGCDQTCHKCGQVCPTEAIRRLDLEEKTHAKMGTAYIDRNRCIVWVEDRLCLICDEQCPYDAIVFRWEDDFRRPFVVGSRCNGCGFCEQQCPVTGESAILITPDGEIRLKEGSYIEEAKFLQLRFDGVTEDDDFFPEK